MIFKGGSFTATSLVSFISGIGGVFVEMVIFQILVGLSTAMLYWVVSVGLTFIFGVTRVLNFAHGSFYMLGAFFTLTLFKWTNNFVLSAALGSLAVGIIGLLCERGVIRFTYSLPVAFQLVLTFGLVLIFEDLVRFTWGSVPQMMQPLGLGTVMVAGRRFPIYSFIIMGIGLFLWIILYFLLLKTKLGLMIRATISDIELAMANGINPHFLYSFSFFFGSLLAGLGGAITLPMCSASLGMGERIIIYSFIITVMGGLGNIKGAFISSLIIGVSESLCALFVPGLTIAISYIILAMILVVKPEGIYGEA